LKEKLIDLIFENPLISCVICFIIAILLFLNAHKDKRSFDEHGLFSWKAHVASYVTSFILILVCYGLLKEYLKSI